MGWAIVSGTMQLMTDQNWSRSVPCYGETDQTATIHHRTRNQSGEGRGHLHYRSRAYGASAATRASNANPATTIKCRIPTTQQVKIPRR